MKKTLLATFSLTISVGSVLAADMPLVKDPVVSPPPFTWTSLYGGINVGYGLGAGGTDIGWLRGLYHSGAYSKNIPAAWLHSVFPSGVIGGGQIGYNYQFNPNIVFGIEADFQGSDMNTADAYFGFGLSQNFVKSNKSIDWFGTTRGRIGLTIPGYSNVLLYGTGGFAYGQVYNNVSAAHLWSGGATCGGATGTSTYNQTKTGWTAGGGIEWSPQSFSALSLKAEYLYTDLGATNQSIFSSYDVPAGTSFFGARHQSPTQFNTARLGLNWHFTPSGVTPAINE